MRHKTYIAALLLLLALSSPPAPAGEESDYRGRTVRAGVHNQAPFVMNSASGGHTGLAVELWEKAAGDGLGMTTEYTAYPSFAELFAALEKGEVDVAVSSIAVTHERSRRMIFSFPWYDAGLRVMTAKGEKPSLWNELKKSQRFRIYLGFFALLVVLSLLMTWVRKKKDPEFPKDAKTGYTLSLLDIVSSVRSGEIEQEYLGWLGHILSSVWMITGLAMVAYVTSTMTTAMTAVKLDKDGIYGLSDLPGKRVGVLRGGLVQRYLGDMKLGVVPFDELEDAAARLKTGRLHAVVTDAPALEYYVAKHPEANLEAVGEVFHPDKYAFAASPAGARMMDGINVELIRLGEQGVIDELRKKYFAGVEE